MSWIYGTFVGTVRGLSPWILRMLKKFSGEPASERAEPAAPHALPGSALWILASALRVELGALSAMFGSVVVEESAY